MTQEEKAKRYDESIEKARQFHNENCDACKMCLESIFDEFKESEDKRILKEIIKLVKFYYGSSLACKHTVSENEMVSWLEKQGEQKPTEKLEPKFNVGDWIVFAENHNSIYQVEKIDNYRYYLRHYLGGTLSVHFDNELIRRWTIADAKDGEVLANCNIICIYKKRESEHLIKVHINYSVAEGVEETNDTIGDFNLYPATKEERDLLFSKMKEEGWEWVAEKKELKRVQKQRIQKTTDKVKIKFNIGDWITDGKHTRLVIDGHSPLNYTLLEQDGNILSGTIENIQHTHHLWTIEDAKDGDVLISENDYPFIYAGNHIYTKYLTAHCGIDNDGEFKISDKTELWTNDNVKPASKEEYDLLFQKMKEVGYRWNNEKKEINKIENEEKPKWTADDERHENTIIHAIHGAGNITPIDGELAEKWLKSLKKRME